MINCMDWRTGFACKKIPLEDAMALHDRVEAAK